jgi:hypothetical protein
MTHTDSGLDYAMTGDVTMGQGWIVSKPDENARRVRLLVQGQPGPTTGMLIGFIYKQGNYTGVDLPTSCSAWDARTPADPNSTGPASGGPLPFHQLQQHRDLPPSDRAGHGQRPQPGLRQRPRHQPQQHPGPERGHR